MKTSMEEQGQKRPDYLLPASIVIAGVLVAGSIIYLVGSQKNGGQLTAQIGQNNGQSAQTQGLAIGDRDVVLGNANAPVTLIEYSDFQCPFCARFFSETEGQIRDNYIQSGKVKMVYRNFPFLGPESLAAANAAECAKDQKQFWAYHDLLFQNEIQDGSENNGNLNRDLFLKLAGDLKLDTQAFTQCLDSQKYANVVQQSVDTGRSVGVNSTPTIFVNDRMIQGALPYTQFQSAIEAALAAAKN